MLATKSSNLEKVKQFPSEQNHFVPIFLQKEKHSMDKLLQKQLETILIRSKMIRLELISDELTLKIDSFKKSEWSPKLFFQNSGVRNFSRY